MLEPQKGKQLATRIVKVAENLEQAQDEIDYIESALARVDEQAEELETVDDILSAIESDIASIEALTSDELTELSEAAKLTFVDLPPDRMQRNSRLNEGADPLEVLKTLFQSEIEAKLRNDSFRMALKWEPFDYWAVGTAGLLAAVTDFFLVGLPAGVHAGPITAWLKSFNSNKGGDCLSLVAQEMERVCKVPYDTLKGTESIAGMCGRTHRFQSLGHDPVVGFVFGVLDILRGSITAFSYDQLTRAHKFIRTESPSGVSGVTLIEAFLLQLGHLGTCQGR